MPNPLSGKTVAVIGASAGIGLAVARAAAERSAKLILAGRNMERLEKAAQEIGVICGCVAVDTTDEQSVSKFWDQVGMIDHLAIPGSTVKTGKLSELSIEDAQQTMSSKFWGPYFIARGARIAEGGSILLFSGALSRRPAASASLLSAINAAVEAFGKALAVELAPVRVNVLSPGLIAHTDAYSSMPDAAREKMFAQSAKHLPVRRTGEPGDVAEAAMMLFENPFMTGAVVDVDGGGLLA